MPDGIKQKRFAAEYLAGKNFDQKICSPFRDVARSNKRLGPSLLPRNTARHARGTTPRTATGSMGEENEDHDFDDCRIGADCVVHRSVRSRCRASPPSRQQQRTVPRHQRLRGAGGVGDLGLQLRWWRIGTGRALIFSQAWFLKVCSADIPKEGPVAGDRLFSFGRLFSILARWQTVRTLCQLDTKWLLSGHDCCLDATVPDDLSFIQPSFGLRRFLATPLHEIISP